jgi:hypothetical protein
MEPLLVRNSASEAAGPLTMAVEDSAAEGSQAGGNFGAANDGTQASPPGLTGAPQTG